LKLWVSSRLRRGEDLHAGRREEAGLRAVCRARAAGHDRPGAAARCCVARGSPTDAPTGRGGAGPFDPPGLPGVGPLPTFKAARNSAPMCRSEFESVVAAQAREPDGGLVVIADAFTSAHRVEITSLAARYRDNFRIRRRSPLTARHRIPAVYPSAFWVKSGGLICYGVDYSDLQRRAAAYVDRILKGAKPQDLPVQLPTKFEFVINLKVAKALGFNRVGDVACVR
jgi:ABC transporter substrate binding protein